VGNSPRSATFTVALNKVANDPGGAAHFAEARAAHGDDLVAILTELTRELEPHILHYLEVKAKYVRFFLGVVDDIASGGRSLQFSIVGTGPGVRRSGRGSTIVLEVRELPDEVPSDG
jgi:hypothetical protein